MISVAEALDHVVSGLNPVGTEDIALSDCLGRILATDVTSNLTYPPSNVSAMDGYAVRAVDTSSTPAVLNVSGMSQAGAGYDGCVGNGEAVRIFTGAPVPDGADSVVIQENTELDGDCVVVNESVQAGTFVRPAGLDFSEGDVIRPAGHRLSARDIGLLAAANVATVPVFKNPRIAYLATGDELVMPGETPGPDQIISSNSVAMDAYIRVFGGEPVSLGIAKDNPDSLRSALKGLKGCDMLVTMGGASVGDFDLVQSVLGDEGMELGFYKVAMRPGKPLIFGTLDGVPMLGLPGNPVSAGVTALLFLRPAIARLSGADDETIVRRARLGKRIRENDRRQDYLRASLSQDSDGGLVATPFERQDSSMMRLLAYADCLIVRPPHADSLPAESEVDVVVFGATNRSF